MCFVITKDGTQLFYATRNQLIHQYDLVNKKEVKFWRAHEGPIHTMDIDPSGHYLLTGSADHTAKVLFLKRILMFRFGILMAAIAPTTSSIPSVLSTLCDSAFPHLHSTLIPVVMITLFAFGI